MLSPRKLTRAFRRRGLTLSSGALQSTLNFLSNSDPALHNVDSTQELLELLVVRVKEYTTSSRHKGAPSNAPISEEDISALIRMMRIEENPVQAAVQAAVVGGGAGAPPSSSSSSSSAAAAAAAAAAAREFIHVVSAFETPKFRFQPARQSMKRVPMSSGEQQLFGSAEAKSQRLRDRFQLLLHACQREFSRPSMKKSDAGMEITSIRGLRGRTGELYSFGMLTRDTDGNLMLEDADAKVGLALDTLQSIPSGFVTEGCFVLVQGEMYDAGDGKFHVSEFGLPPWQDRQSVLQRFPALEQFGLEMYSPSDRAMLERTERAAAQDDVIFFLSNVYLDRPRTMEFLESMLRRCVEDEAEPQMLVLMGNFTSHPVGTKPSDLAQYARMFEELADLILEFPSVAASTRIVIVPGPTDPGYGNVLPRPPIPNYFTKKLTSKLPRVTLATNPCRISYYSHEIFAFREDLLHKFMRHSLFDPLHQYRARTGNDEEDAQPAVPVSRVELSDHMIETIVSQANVCPLPLNVQPVFWDTDHALTFFPLPHLMLLADSVDQYSTALGEDNCALNPGTFATDSSFVCYYPCRDVTKRADDDDGEDEHMEEEEDGGLRVMRRVEFSRVLNAAV